MPRLAHPSKTPDDRLKLRPDSHDPDSQDKAKPRHSLCDRLEVLSQFADTQENYDERLLEHVLTIRKSLQ